MKKTNIDPRNKQASEFFPGRLQPFSRGVLTCSFPWGSMLTHKGKGVGEGKTHSVKRGQHAFGIWKADAALQESSHFFFKGPDSK